MTIRGGGNPNTAMAAVPLGEWTRRLGALPVEAYHCFMVGVPLDPTDYKRGWRESSCAHRQAPLGSSVEPCTRSLQHAAVLTSVRTGPSGRQLKKRAILDRRCARRRRQCAVGMEECSRRGSNKRME